MGGHIGGTGEIRAHEYSRGTTTETLLLDLTATAYDPATGLAVAGITFDPDYVDSTGVHHLTAHVAAGVAVKVYSVIITSSTDPRSTFAANLDVHN